MILGCAGDLPYVQEKAFLGVAQMPHPQLGNQTADTDK